MEPSFHSLLMHAWSHVGENLVWYGGAEVSYYAGDKKELARLWMTEALRSSLCSDVASSKGLEHLKKVTHIKRNQVFGYVLDAIEEVETIRVDNYMVTMLLGLLTSDSASPVVQDLRERMFGIIAEDVVPILDDLYAIPRFALWLVYNASVTFYDEERIVRTSVNSECSELTMYINMVTDSRNILSLARAINDNPPSEQYLHRVRDINDFYWDPDSSIIDSLWITIKEEGNLESADRLVTGYVFSHMPDLWWKYVMSPERPYLGSLSRAA